MHKTNLFALKCEGLAQRNASKEAEKETICNMGNMKDIADSIRGDLIPQLYVLRWVPMRYRQLLPLKVMKQYQCLVVGSAQGVLTVAFTDRHNTTVIEALRRFTGQPIFPVLIDANRMHLLIQRIERSQQYRKTFDARARQYRPKAYYLHIARRLQIGSIVMFLMFQETRRL
jgi:Type II secretion system (T2SS), protein E, N-terminal domain